MKSQLDVHGTNEQTAALLGARTPRKPTTKKKARLSAAPGRLVPLIATYSRPPRAALVTTDTAVWCLSGANQWRAGSIHHDAH
jgi:hypothetical protein